MNKNVVVTINRQFGCGGRVIGKKLAEKMGIPYFDHQLIEMSAQKCGMDKSVFEKVDEKVNKRYYFSLFTPYMHNGAVDLNIDLTANDKLFFLQTELIQELAVNPCVIVGRCADFILKDMPNVLSVYLYADTASRAERAVNDYGVDPKKVESYVKNKDKERATYYEYYTNQLWTNPENYKLMINSNIGVDKVVDLIISFIEQNY